jgi:CRP-like cAMP-binding protein
LISELQATTLFHNVDLSHLAKVTEFCEEVELSDGDPLIAENTQDSRDLYIILSGQVEVLSSGSKNTSSEIVMSDQDKEVFGEISWITGASRTATIRSIGTTNVIRIKGDEFSQFLDNFKETGFLIMKNLATILAQRMIQTNNLLKQLLWNMQL